MFWVLLVLHIWLYLAIRYVIVIMELNIFHYLLISIGINVLFFIPAYIFQTDKLTDFTYSLTYILLIVFLFFITPYSVLNLLLMSIVVLWALRLGIYLFIRINKMKRDKRFDGLRKSFVKFGGFWILQGFAVWVILIPSFFFMNSEVQRLCWIGLFVWILGFVIETIADYQKFKFKQNKANKGLFIKNGLWKYSRHPNYFGEILCWLGIYLLTILSLEQKFMVIGLISPIFISILLIFVSGLPQLEKTANDRWANDKEYQEYKEMTSILILWFPKKRGKRY